MRVVCVGFSPWLFFDCYPLMFVYGLCLVSLFFVP